MPHLIAPSARDATGAPAVSAHPPGAAIVTERLTKRFDALTAVDSVSLVVPHGQVLAVLGPNGAGKSTIIDMVLGLTRPDTGRVRLFGRSPRDAVAAGLVGGMLQTGSLLEDLSVRELVDMIASLYPHPLPVDDVLALSGAAPIADRRTDRLSGGQMQTVRFAVALVADAELLLLDEPTAALDVEARREFWATVGKVAAQGKTVVFATHYLEEADANADRIVLMARGRIVADGSSAEIKAMVGSRTIEATLPGVATASLRRLSGVSAVDRRRERVTLTCADSDRALRQLLVEFPSAHDIEVRGAGIEEAFVALTTDEETADLTAGSREEAVR